jgi:YD repeat-containing protein
VQISYTDSFSDDLARNTLAYPTTFTDPDNYISTTKYNFDFGAVTFQRTPKPNTAQHLPNEGPVETITYDEFGRIQQVTNQVNGAYTRFVYPEITTRIDAYSTIQDGLGEAHSFQFTDGGGRVIGTATQHPGSEGGYSGQTFEYDIMGRTIRTSNPTETEALGEPSEWTAVGDDNDWIYTQQTYDWKSRPLVTTNQDGSTKIISYTGCGCAGGEVVTFSDEGGASQRRQQRAYSDVLGRTIKIETLNWQGGSVYSATVNTYDARDQLTRVRQYAGAEGSSAYQDTDLSYDSFGRMLTKHLPEQATGTTTTWTYNNDDTVNSITDARGASQTFTYNNRALLISIAYGVPVGSGIAVPAEVTFTYDGAGNRLSMTDGFGTKSYQYDLLSRLTQESRQLPVGTFAISYSYNLAGQLINLTGPFGASFSYTRDVQGRLQTLTGSPFGGVTNYVNDVGYRAWGAVKSVAYNGSSATVTFNERLQPTQFRHTVNGTNASILRQNYSYFPDSRLATVTDLDDAGGINPPATLRFLSRSYSYDHVGRATGGQGTGIATMPAVPYSQGYSYDAFGNMTGRSGAYYVYTQSPPFSSDTSTYINNRRTNWSYNADGQLTSTPSTGTDAPRSMTYDAAGRMITSVETGQVSTSTYSATYDGDGHLVYEASTTSPGSSTASYIVRSTVLGGEVLTRLDQSGNKLLTHVPAEGLLFARQNSSLVITTYRDPLGITETGKGIYDPLGNYIPFQASGDPRPPAGSYNSGSMSGLVSSQANANSYSVGCVRDAVPTNCNNLMAAINHDQAKKVGVVGFAVTPALMRLMASLTEVGAEFRSPVPPPKRDPEQPPSPLDPPQGPGWQIQTAELWTYFIIAPGLQQAFEQNSQNTDRRLTKDETNDLKDRIADMLSDPNCRPFTDDLLSKLEDGENPPFSKDPLALFAEIDRRGGYNYSTRYNYNTVLGNLRQPNAAVLLVPPSGFGPARWPGRESAIL